MGNRKAFNRYLTDRAGQLSENYIYLKTKSIIMRTGLILLLFSNFFISSMAQLSLTVEINNLSNNTGKVLLELLDGKEQRLLALSAKIEDNTCIFVISDLKPGKYAFKYFHDENVNKELDTNWMGVPSEGFGFSNNAKIKFGPPSFSDMIFDVNENTKVECLPTYINF
ncbi:MAG: DUF2141 domain-containing protein [Bacteroidales bacterium]|nr:DUF2141 domain-containing protein [Bacteroidales bacterium]MCF8390743.1 DUF2141 domain-containing protein [Bacteroidales bacterium]